MRHIIFEESSSGYPIALLIKDAAFVKHELERAYMDKLHSTGISRSDIIGFTLDYNANGKAPVKHIKEYLGNLLPALQQLGTQYLYCADAAYFKALTGAAKAEPHLGYVMPCKVQGFEDMKVILGVNHKSLIYNPANEPKLTMSLDTLVDAFQGNYQPLGGNIIHYAGYPETNEEIAAWLDKLQDYPQLTMDIETASLRFNKAGIATITFCWSKHEGIAFLVDYVQLDTHGQPKPTAYGTMVVNGTVRHLLKQFFTTYQGKMIWHNSPYDIKVLIYNLWMKDTLDNQGLLDGLHIMCRNFQDTKIIAYLATNTTAGNKLSLKDLAHEFAGNWAVEEINNVLAIPQSKLLQYNLVDGLSTFYVYEKYYPVMVADRQEELYYTMMLPSQKVITQLELTGMPLDMAAVADARLQLEAIQDKHSRAFVGKAVIAQLEAQLTQEAWEKDFADRKGKAKNPDKIFPKDRATFPHSVFNPNSNQQLQKLLYEIMGLPVIDLTKSKQPATGADTLEKLINHTSDPDYKEILEALIGHGKAAKILSSFIPAFEDGVLKQDGNFYLHGSFNLGGTVSGRLSSSKPNLQNIPSGSTYGKLIKQCVKAPKGWLFGGADFNSLEDYISALTTKDPNKLKVYLEGYDGHCLRAFSYFPERLPGIVNTVESINSIKKMFEDIRQLSKTPTFALTYAGTYITLMKNLGFDEATAKQIEANYHELYKVSDDWVKAKLQEASERGYVEVAFGLRVRTPLLAQTLRGHRTTPYEAEAEGRTAGNALGQSYGLLNNRACNEFMAKVWASPYRNDIKPVAMIHDAIYLMIRDDIEVVEWVNRELIKSMQWQELPEIQHDKVKLGASLGIFWPNWSNEVELPNNASQEQIRQICNQGITTYYEEKEAA